VAKGVNDWRAKFEQSLCGAAALQVYTSSFTETGVCEDVALKVIDIPSSIHDPCYQVPGILHLARYQTMVATHT
jgi:hypothetical protein